MSVERVSVWPPFFKRLLDVPTKEKQLRRVNVKEDVTDAAVGGLIYFMYHCDVPDDCKEGVNLIDLFRLSHQ